MAQMRRDVLRLDRGRHHLEDIEMMPKLRILSIVLRRAGATPSDEIRGMGRASTGLKDEAAQLQKDVAMSHTGTACD